ncbi:MAG: serine acetyltransferase [Lentisphaerae bacterium RIFOXYA12_FULL_48_11]|nr:MAG: serine acetyltransferase [Lentisphaerae bacterium RIFOXYA12_FULL_48_11]
MIESRAEYLQYLEADRIALGIKTGTFKTKFAELIYPNPVWNFQKALRKLEYYCNCRSDIISRLYYYYLEYKFRKLSIRLGFTIPRNVFGPGLAIVHYGTIVVNDRARIGKNCRIHACTNIGASRGKPEAPQIGDNVYIGPGVCIFGDIKIGSGIAIGANSTVNKSFEEDNIMIAGSPATKIKEIDISNIIKHLSGQDRNGQ